MDPFTTEVIRHGLASIAEEMTLIVMRSARSPALREAGDLSSALTAADGGIIAQGRDLPIHLGVMSYSVKELLHYVGLERIQEGDVWILNQPTIGGNHLPDVKLIRPIFAKGGLAAFAISLAHWADIGGAAPGSYYAAAEDSWQEGLQMPPVKVYKRDRPVTDVLALIKANVRGEHEREGDLLAQCAAVRAADQRVRELIAKFGRTTFDQALRQMRDLTERQVRDVIRRIPDGVYTGEDWLDDDGHGGAPVAIRAKVTVRGETIEFDLSDSADALRAPLNTTPYVAATAVVYFLKSIAEEEIFHTDGALRPVTITTRRGSVLDPGPGRPVVGGNHETSQRVVDAVVKALADALPEAVSAGGCGSAGLVIFSGERDDGSWWTFYETHGGGEGGRAERPGIAATRVHLSNMMNTLAEFIEAEYPIRVLRSAVRQGSGGVGRNAGGDGLVREYLVLADDVHLTTMFQRRVVPAYGLFGGEDGAPFAVTLLREDRRQPLSSSENMRLRRGDVVLVETAGGGGYGVRAQVP